MDTEEQNSNVEQMLDNLAESLDYNENGNSSVDSLIDYKNAVEGILCGLWTQFRAAADTLATATDTDDDYWSAVATGQDTAEAEDSGYLRGYRDAMEAARLLVAAGGEEPTIQNYLDAVRERAEDQRDEITDIESATA